MTARLEPSRPSPSRRPWGGKHPYVSSRSSLPTTTTRAAPSPRTGCFAPRSSPCTATLVHTASSRSCAAIRRPPSAPGRGTLPSSWSGSTSRPTFPEGRRWRTGVAVWPAVRYEPCRSPTKGRGEPAGRRLIRREGAKGPCAAMAGRSTVGCAPASFPAPPNRRGHDRPRVDRGRRRRRLGLQSSGTGLGRRGGHTTTPHPAGPVRLALRLPGGVGCPRGRRDGGRQPVHRRGGGRARTGGRPELDISTNTVHAQAASALIAASRHADTVVVGARGVGALTEAFLGSTSMQVAAYASCPVVVVREPLRIHGGPRRVVVGVDGSDLSNEATGYAFEQASGRGLGLTVLHAWSANMYTSGVALMRSRNRGGARGRAGADHLRGDRAVG